LKLENIDFARIRYTLHQLQELRGKVIGFLKTILPQAGRCIMQRPTQGVRMLCANEKPATGFQRNVLALLRSSDHRRGKSIHARTLINIEFRLSRKALEAPEVFSIGIGAWCVR
jgi:hypothetical protein